MPSYARYIWCGEVSRSGRPTCEDNETDRPLVISAARAYAMNGYQWPVPALTFLASLVPVATNIVRQLIRANACNSQELASPFASGILLGPYLGSLPSSHWLRSVEQDSPSHTDEVSLGFPLQHLPTS